LSYNFEYICISCLFKEYFFNKSFIRFQRVFAWWRWIWLHDLRDIKAQQRSLQFVSFLLFVYAFYLRLYTILLSLWLNWQYIGTIQKSVLDSNVTMKQSHGMYNTSSRYYLIQLKKQLKQLWYHSQTWENLKPLIHNWNPTQLVIALL